MRNVGAEGVHVRDAGQQVSIADGYFVVAVFVGAALQEFQRELTSCGISVPQKKAGKSRSSGVDVQRVGGSAGIKAEATTALLALVVVLIGTADFQPMFMVWRP